MVPSTGEGKCCSSSPCVTYFDSATYSLLHRNLLLCLRPHLGPLVFPPRPTLALRLWGYEIPLARRAASRRLLAVPRPPGQRGMGFGGYSNLSGWGPHPSNPGPQTGVGGWEGVRPGD